MADKVLVGNKQAFRAKYGNDISNIQDAIDRLIAADQGRGLQTIYVPVDDSQAMTAAGGNSVTDPTSPRQNKEAIDAIYNSYTPQYLVLLGSIDVIPHQDLDNPAFNPERPDDDPDRQVPSDLPYACEATYSNNPGDFVGPTRVVSRLPDVTAAQNPAYLIHLLDLACRAVPLTHSDYAAYLGVSAAVWTQSTSLSLGAVFGSATAQQDVPPATSQWPANLLSSRSHFFNCHGAHLSSQYFGQSGDNYPVAHDAAYISGKLTPGTIAAAECCYGAELYDPASIPSGQTGIANVYLDEGAYCFWGSTTIAYGPDTSNAWADTICQYFLNSVLAGASIGRAALAARQTYVKNSPALSPTDLKTLAQFILLGDASVQCVESKAPAEESMRKYAVPGLSMILSKRLERIDRRSSLADEGFALSGSKAVAESSPSAQPSPDVLKMLNQLSVTARLQEPSVRSYRVRGGPEPKLRIMGLEAATTTTAFHLLSERTRRDERTGVVLLHILEIAESNGRMVRVRELFSR
jgi:hypothetical protein